VDGRTADGGGDSKRTSRCGLHRLDADERTTTAAPLQVRRSGRDTGPAPRQGRPAGGRGEAKWSSRSACRLSFPLPPPSLAVAVNGTCAVNFPCPRPIYFPPRSISHAFPFTRSISRGRGQFPAPSPLLGHFPAGAVDFPWGRGDFGDLPLRFGFRRPWRGSWRPPDAIQLLGDT
jgi:hypothetical protein